MPSIKENLNKALMIFLILIIGVFLFLISFALLYLKIPVSIDSIAQIASAIATTIAVVLTLGLRLIDDTLTRYQRFVQPKIRSIQSLLTGSNSGDIKSLIENYSYSIGDRDSELSSITTNILKHGTFFSLKLYPLKTLEKIPILVKKINEYLAAINELKKITTFSNDYAFQQSIELNAAMKLPSCYSLNKESSRCIELSQQIIECRKTILFDIEVLKKELQTFVDEN